MPVYMGSFSSISWVSGLGIFLTSIPPSMEISLQVSVLASAGCKLLPWAILW